VPVPPSSVTATSMLVRTFAVRPSMTLRLSLGLNSFRTVPFFDTTLLTRMGSSSLPPFATAESAMASCRAETLMP
jgi:hypothetical protein